MAIVEPHHYRIVGYDAEKVDDDMWRDLQDIQRTALSASLTHGHGPTEAEVDSLVLWDDPERFAASHRDPNTEVGRRLRDGNSYSDPFVAVAIDSKGKNIGFFYAALNVSGNSEHERKLKRALQWKNHLWAREAAVLPDHQSRSVALAMGHSVLKHFSPFRQMSTYIWPGLLPSMQSNLERLGFRKTGEEQVDLFEHGQKDVRQVRMAAYLATIVHRRISEIPLKSHFVWE
jgi:hypothetical protein